MKSPESGSSQTAYDLPPATEPAKQTKIEKLKSAITEVHLKCASTHAPKKRPAARRMKNTERAYNIAKKPKEVDNSGFLDNSDG